MNLFWTTLILIPWITFAAGKDLSHTFKSGNVPGGRFKTVKTRSSSFKNRNLKVSDNTKKESYLKKKREAEKRRREIELKRKYRNRKNNKYTNDTKGVIENKRSKVEFDSSKTVTTKTDEGEMITIPIMTHLEKLDRNTKIHLDFYEAELSHIVKYISDITGTNFILPANIRGKKITIMSPKKIKAVDALNAFFTVLNMNNYSVLKTGTHYQIVPIQDANKPNFIYYQNQRVPNVDYFITKIYNLKYAPQRDVEILMNKMRSRTGVVITYEPTSMIIYTDTGHRVNTVFDIIKKIDVPSNSVGKLWLIPVYYSDAKELAQTLEEIFDLKNRSRNKQTTSVKISSKDTKNSRYNKKVNQKAVQKAAEKSEEKVEIEKIIADERTNQIIIISNEDSKKKIVELIKKLDIPLEDDSTIHVYRLKNAKAEDIASTINSLSSNINSRSSRSRGSRSRKGGRSSSSSSSVSGVMFQNEVKVTADKSTNSLVIVATGRDYNSLRRVIEMLDLKRMQVYVEAVIMEVSIDKSLDMGVSMTGGLEKEVSGENVPLFGGTNYSSLSTLAVNPTQLTGFAFGAMGPSIDVDLGSTTLSIPSFGVILKALQGNTDTDILSTPYVLTMDNEESEFVVGENVPFPSGISNAYSTSSSSLGYPMVNIQRQDVAIKLSLTPQISGDEQIKMEVKLEITEVKPEADATYGPTTTKRSVKTSVVVSDQETITLGGLMKDKTTKAASKVPLLGDIPIIGNFFQYRSNKKVKSNLLIFLTPYIIRDSNDMKKIWKKKLEEFEEFKRLKDKANKGFDIFIDYNKKRGVLSEINKEVINFENQIKIEKKLNKKSKLRYDIDLETQRDIKKDEDKGDN